MCQLPDLVGQQVAQRRDAEVRSDVLIATGLRRQTKERCPRSDASCLPHRMHRID